MCLAATIFRPLRSKRAMISPESPRANASGLTRIRVLSVAMGRQCGKHPRPGDSRSDDRGGAAEMSCFESGPASAPRACLPRARLGGLWLGDLGRDRRLVGRLTAPAARGGRRRRARLGLAERADAPRGVDRLRARVAAL